MHAKLTTTTTTKKTTTTTKPTNQPPKNVHKLVNACNKYIDFQSHLIKAQQEEDGTTSCSTLLTSCDLDVRSHHQNWYENIPSLTVIII